MFERFDDAARMVIIRAREEADRFSHEALGTEHLLLGLIRGGDHVVLGALRRLGVSLDQVRSELERALAGPRKMETFEEIPFTPSAKRALEAAIGEATQRGLKSVRAEHLMLGLMIEGQSRAAKLLEAPGVSPESIRQELLRIREFLRLP